jgi:hypothetical protein
MTRPRPARAPEAWGPSGRDTTEAAWTIVRRENAELRKSHPQLYAWARAHLDQERRRPKP